MYKVVLFLCTMFFGGNVALYSQQHPNVILIYADDLGFGDVSCNGGTGVTTLNIDQLAKEGIRFTNAHTTSSTCTPSRYGIMTGEYPWRKKGTGILPGDAALIIPTGKLTLPGVFQQAGYTTGLVGKWHLGLGNTVEKNWNQEIKPGPNQVGYHYSFIFPATADRVPTVFLENQKVLNIDSDDPITVDYKTRVGTDPTGKEHPELLKLKSDPEQGHNNTIVNGIGRIGYMTGGKLARWSDEELSFTFLEKAKEFIRQNKKTPFFLTYNLTEPHVPRMPATMFRGKSKLGLRGDALLQLDWAVGEILNELRAQGIEKNTIVIFSSDNGPVLNDGYEDRVVELNGAHKPAGPFRGGKYSLLEGGTRVPFIVSWPGKIRPGVSNALIGQIDLLASFAKYLHQTIPAGNAPDSRNMWAALTGADQKGRDHLVEHSGTLAIVKDGWKYIPANNIPPYFKTTGTESGGSKTDQLYNLQADPAEKENRAATDPGKLKELKALLAAESAEK
ncbi:arylsulfatase [Niabella ginsenosidivorans]|uniref:Arylsulfatase n=1 Tax=Niabella ginsenosidivorans TaxID=1176587 RepID=A0A1A9HZV5_9BACT|nr:arylsulfatase [Niabella ginsenosidivorans]ANH80001.1 arylsulfatase [Niabella ginsenosidivorans]